MQLIDYYSLVSITMKHV